MEGKKKCGREKEEMKEKEMVGRNISIERKCEPSHRECYSQY